MMHGKCSVLIISVYYGIHGGVLKGIDKLFMSATDLYFAAGHNCPCYAIS